MTKKTGREIQRENLAKDIRTYLARGGVVKTYASGESAIEEKKNNATWEKKLRIIPKKGTV